MSNDQEYTKNESNDRDPGVADNYGIESQFQNPGSASREALVNPEPQLAHVHTETVVRQQRTRRTRVVPGSVIVGSKRLTSRPSESEDDASSVMSHSTYSSTFHSSRRHNKVSDDIISKKWLEIYNASQNRQDATAQKLLNKKLGLTNRQTSPAAMRSFRRPTRTENRKSCPAISNGSMEDVEEAESLHHSQSEAQLNSPVFDPDENYSRSNQRKESEHSDQRTSGVDSATTDAENDAVETQSSSSGDSEMVQTVEYNVKPELHLVEQTKKRQSSNENVQIVEDGGKQTKLKSSGHQAKDNGSHQNRQPSIIINIVSPPGQVTNANIKSQENPVENQHTDVITTQPGAVIQGPSPATSENRALIKQKKKKNRNQCVCCFCCVCKCGVSDSEDGD